ncbi:MAG: hypothetical protein JWR62_3002, partial [Modestobacter sp.]|nr:hypothetical protein [Modestobacter sp.]
GEEITAGRNVAAWRRVVFRPDALRSVATRPGAAAFDDRSCGPPSTRW